MKVIALIPARSGSKRIPYKNIVHLAGRPLISHVIETARDCCLIDEVWVSTEDERIAQISKNYGAKIQRRPETLAEDHTKSELVLLHFAEHHPDFDVMCFIQATSPLTLSSHLESGINMVITNQCDSTLSVCEDHRFYWGEDRKPINYDLDNRPFTQEKDKWYKETGAFYITTKKSLLQSKCRVSGRIEFVIVPEKYNYEIDTIEDLEIIKKVMELNLNL